MVTALLTAAALSFAPSLASATPPDQPANPWQADHWPQRQPWQEQRPAVAHGVPGFPAPIDPQKWVNPDHMTWQDYKKIPGTNWADPAVPGSTRQFRGALVLADFSDKPFVVTQPQNSTVFGNPTAEAHDVPRDTVARFYQDLLNKPGTLNRGHTIHEYWMEDSGGRYGVNLTAFGPYKLAGKAHEYGMDFQDACPPGDNCNRNFAGDARSAWIKDVGSEVPKGFDFVFFVSAGQDESGAWQEFGMMKFPKKEDVTDPFGPPASSMPNWSGTRYVDWTSWAAGASIWPHASGGYSVQTESSGMSVYAHEFSHILGIGDNYNNPYGQPPHRAFSGIWDMLSRGTFNGPGGPHSRWPIPATAGATMGAQHMLRNKMKLNMVGDDDVLRLSRGDLAKSGVVVTNVKARSLVPGESELSGINIQLDGGDHSGPCDPDTDPLCDFGKYDNYTLEIVDRMGTDSFTPDSGVLLAKTRNVDQAPFIWVVDANPQDIGMTDYVLPDGTKVPITIGDYRQLSDSLFHAGTNSGSEYEYVDEANRLHFYVLGVHRDQEGLLSYTVAIRNLDGAGAQQRGVAVKPTSAAPDADGLATCQFPVTNTGSGGSPGSDSDVYRLSATAGDSWQIVVPNDLAVAKAGHEVRVPVYARAKTGDAGQAATVTLTAKSESDPSKTQTADCTIQSR
ncbi:M6 family metalloprotease domain-containing protein [Herbihabitans rhizosphaerae]